MKNSEIDPTMAEISIKKSATIDELMGRLDLYKHNPSNIQRVIYDYLEEVTSGEVNIVDPTSPFVFLMESSAVNTALAVNESISALRKLYPSMAQTEKELYLHLSDVDYLNRFATPSDVNFTVAVQLNDLMGKMVYDDLDKAHKATIPRDTEFRVDDYTFTLQYPIDIRRYSNGVVQISYDARIQSPIERLNGNIIDYTVRKNPDGVSWIFFKVKVKQLTVQSTTFPVQKSAIFNQSIPHSDQFYYVRSFYRNNNTNNQWMEIKTTHTDQVFDPFVPTAVIQTLTNSVTVSIPPVYITTGLISGEVRFDIYSTKGSLTVNLSNYKMNSFTMRMQAIDESRDINAYTNAMSTLSSFCYSDEIISGGSLQIDFERLRDRVIYSSTGNQNLPITNKQLEAFTQARGFELVKNVDSVTNRIFLATRKLPKPINSKLATSANIGITSFISSMENLKRFDTVKSTNQRLTILSKNVFKNTNGILSMLSSQEVRSIKALSKVAQVTHVNNNSYLYNPFYYVLDDSNAEFEVRAYNLDYPQASNLSFISQNQSLQLPVNTDNYSLSKTSFGYRLTIQTKSGNFYKQLSDEEVHVQLAYFPDGESRLAYINGTLTQNTDDNERIYEFEIHTNFDIDSDHRLYVTNAKMFDNESLGTWLNLKTQFHLFYSTTSVVRGFVPDEADGLLGKFLLPNNSSVTTHETLDLQIGAFMKNLWSRSRSMATGFEYSTHESDIPMLYDRDVYDQDPITGSIFTIENDDTVTYRIKHPRGSQVLDNAGLPVYRHRRGDVRLNTDGSPIIVSDMTVNKEIDILVVDGRNYFADDIAYIDYGNELVGILDTWVTSDVQEISEVLLEQSRIYFYPKTTLGKVKIFTQDQGQGSIDSEQSLILDIYVRSDIYNDAVIRQQLSDTAIRLLDTYISATIINTTEIIQALSAQFGENVRSIHLEGLGGSANYKILSVATEHNRLCLKKILKVQQDNTLIVAEDVTVNFYRAP